MTDVIVALASGLAGGGTIGVLTSFYINRRKQLHAETMDYVPRLEKRIGQLEKADDDCRESLAMYREKVGRLEERIRHMEEADVTRDDLKDLTTAMGSRLDLIHEYLKQRTHDVIGAIDPLKIQVPLLTTALNQMVMAAGKPLIPEPAKNGP